MKMMNKGKRVKGFTLTEMIIVVAIIGILTAVLAPTMTTYYWKARVRTANSDAKMVYNAAQNAVQRAAAADKVISDGNKKSPFGKGLVVVSYDAGTGQVTYSATDPDEGVSLQGLDTKKAPDAAVNRFADIIFNSVTDSREVCWAVRISNYTVQAAVSANSSGTNNVGRYSVGNHEIEKASGSYSSVFLDILDEDARDYQNWPPSTTPAT